MQQTVRESCQQNSERCQDRSSLSERGAWQQQKKKKIAEKMELNSHNKRKTKPSHSANNVTASKADTCACACVYCHCHQRLQTKACDHDQGRTRSQQKGKKPVSAKWCHRRRTNMTDEEIFESNKRWAENRWCREAKVAEALSNQHNKRSSLLLPQGPSPSVPPPLSACQFFQGQQLCFQIPAMKCIPGQLMNPQTRKRFQMPGTNHLLC